ncbi:MAG: CHAT domain-containing protein, partial [Prochlorotrichaceae cyanobacterium]
MSIYALNVDTDVTTGVIRFRLEDEQGVHLAARQVQLSDLTTATWEGLFDTRQYVQRYAGSVYLGETLATAESLLADLGVKLGRSLLGEEILGHLTQSQQRRSLLVKLPAEGDALAVALARVPWEIARSSADALPLMEQNLVVRLETQADRPQPQEVGTELRVLLVFAEAPGARPLAMRQEREELQALFKEIMHRSKVRLDVLCHGVSRSILRDQIARAGGYHVVHWSGHGHLNLLELCDEDGKSDTISGEGLVNLFREAGGFIPQLVFLSACLSGTFVEVKDWATLGALLRGEDQKGAESPERELTEVLTQAQGYTGTALALLGAGVPQAIAMRYEVGDD